MKKVLLMALAWYMLLAPVTFHPDTKLTLNYATLDGGRVVNIYKYLESVETHLPDFHYPPLHYFLLKTELPLMRWLGGEKMIAWLNMGANVAYLDDNIWWYNLVTKLPLLLLTLGTGQMLYLIVKKYGREDRARLAAVFWLFNPVVLFSVVMMGQNDVLAIFPFVVGMWFYLSNPLLAFGLFGLAGSIKLFPLLWALALAAVHPRVRLGSKVWLALVAVGVYVMTIMPYVTDVSFRQSVLFSGLSERMLIAGIDLGFETKVLIVPLLLMGWCVWNWRNKKSWEFLAVFLVVTNMIILGWSHFHPQWAVWCIPFWAIALAFMKKERRFESYLVLAIFVLTIVGLTLMYDDKFLYWGIFSPINSGLMNYETIPQILAARKVEPLMLRSILQSLFLGMTFWWLRLRPIVANGSTVVNFKMRWLVLAWLSLLLVVSILPVLTVESNESPGVVYENIRSTSGRKQSFVAGQDDLYRVEVLLKNPGYESQDSFELSVSGPQGVLGRQEYKWMNLSDPGWLRMNLPKQEKSKDVSYVLQISTDGIVDDRTQVGVSKEGVMVYKAYYKSRLSISTIGEKWREVLIRIYNNSWIFLPALALILVVKIWK